MNIYWILKVIKIEKLLESFCAIKSDSIYTL